MLTASNATEYSYEGEPIEGAVTTGSVFTSALMNGLRTGAADADRDGHITVDEAYTYAYDLLRAVGAAQTPQRWAYKSEGTIVLARSPAGRVVPALSQALRAALDSPLPAIRIAAVGELGAWLDSGDPTRQHTAVEQLREIADRDDPQVAGAARALLGTGRTAGAAQDATAEAATGQSKPKASQAKTAASQKPPTAGLVDEALDPQFACGWTGRPHPHAATPSPRDTCREGERARVQSRRQAACHRDRERGRRRGAVGPADRSASARPDERHSPAADSRSGMTALISNRWMAFSPDGRQFAASGFAFMRVRLWDPATGRSQCDILGPGLEHDEPASVPMDAGSRSPPPTGQCTGTTRPPGNN